MLISGGHTKSIKIENPDAAYVTKVLKEGISATSVLLEVTFQDGLLEKTLLRNIDKVGSTQLENYLRAIILKQSQYNYEDSKAVTAVIILK